MNINKRLSTRESVSSGRYIVPRSEHGTSFRLLAHSGNFHLKVKSTTICLEIGPIAAANSATKPLSERLLSTEPVSQD